MTGRSSRDGGAFNKKQLNIASSIYDRSIFRYNWRDNFINKWSKSCHWFFCECCGCLILKRCFCRGRRYKKSKNERIYATGTRKLYQEIDILELVKQ